MALKLSSFLQLKPNVYVYQKLGWKMALIYMLILGKIYFLLKQEEKRKILGSVERVFGGRKEPSEVKAIGPERKDRAENHCAARRRRAGARMAPER